MGQKYDQLTIEERCEIARLRASGVSIRQIAAALDRSPSTIAREMKRNAAQDLMAQAHKLAMGLAHPGLAHGSLFLKGKPLRDLPCSMASHEVNRVRMGEQVVAVKLNRLKGPDEFAELDPLLYSILGHEFV